MKMETTVAPVKGAAEPDIEWLLLDADDVAAAAIELLQALGQRRLDPATKLQVNGLALNLKTYLETRGEFLMTKAAASLTPTFNSKVVGETSWEPYPVAKADEIVTTMTARSRISVF